MEFQGRVNWNGPGAGSLMRMSKTTKALKKQAATSQSVAQRAGSPFVVQQMTSLAAAFRAQAAVLKKKNKKKK
jgi:hypothetical protein